MVVYTSYSWRVIALCVLCWKSRCVRSQYTGSR